MWQENVLSFHYSDLPDYQKTSQLHTTAGKHSDTGDARTTCHIYSSAPKCGHHHTLAAVIPTLGIKESSDSSNSIS